MSRGQRDACDAINEQLLSDPAAAKKRSDAVSRRWAISAEAAAILKEVTATLTPPQCTTSDVSRVVLPRSSLPPPSSLTCGDIRIISSSPSSSFTTLSFRDARDTDSDDALPVHHRAHSAIAPGSSSDASLSFAASLPLPDLEPLHRSIDELTLCPSADEYDLDADFSSRD